MDPTALALAVLSALAPFAKKGAETVAAELGKKAVELGSGLVQTLRARWGIKPAETDVLDGFLANPEGHRDRFAMTLAIELSRDAELRTAVEGLLRGEPPEVIVRQVTENTESAVGAEIDEMSRGKLTVELKSTGGGSSVGARIHKLGGPPDGPGESGDRNR